VDGEIITIGSFSVIFVYDAAVNNLMSLIIMENMTLSP
jgi:hypothetical protein